VLTLQTPFTGCRVFPGSQAAIAPSAPGRVHRICTPRAKTQASGRRREQPDGRGSAACSVSSHLELDVASSGWRGSMPRPAPERARYRRAAARQLNAGSVAQVATEIELRRHTDADGDVLTAEGVAAALAIGARLRGGYYFAVSTGAQRATQTLA